MKLKRDKRIGKVILIVEGAKHEFNLMKKIFVDTLGYTQIEKRRESEDFYVCKGDCHSIIAVINTRTSNISSINDIQYLEMIFKELIEQYSFDVDNAAIYYLFDRDPESNANKFLINNLIETLKNSRENDHFIRGGMLILSYPAIEAYEISNFIEDSFRQKAKLGSEIKEYINKNAKIISMNKICDNSILYAGAEMMKFLKEKGIPLVLDDFSSTNRLVFEEEEKCFNDEQKFQLLSMFSCVLMDLGIMEE